MQLISTDQIKEMLEKELQGAAVEVIDLTGTQDHFEARVTWKGFEGKDLIAQHQMVNKALSSPLEDGRIHALKIRTKVS